MELLYIRQDILITMTPLMLALHLVCLIWGRTALTTRPQSSTSVNQESGFISADVGDSVTLRCFLVDDTAAVVFWYKQSLGQKPTLISSFYGHGKKQILTDELENKSRFLLDADATKNHLRISDLQISDSATYYCVSCYAYNFEFAEGTTLSVTDSTVTVPALVHHSTSGSIQSGDSVTLNCTVHTGTCDGEHSVYWFRHSEESHPGLIYTHGGRNDQCERKDNTQTHTCVYNLPPKDLNASHAGTYYCAVASCGHILFGNETKLDFKGEDKLNSLQFLVYVLSGALAFAGILVVFLTFSIFKIRNENSCSAEAQTVSTSATTHGEGTQDADNLHYAALKEHRPPRSTAQRGRTNNECVYSSVRQ